MNRENNTSDKKWTEEVRMPQKVKAESGKPMNSEVGHTPNFQDQCGGLIVLIKSLKAALSNSWHAI